MASSDGAAEVGRALRQGLNIPVCALRASIEALSREIPRHDEGRVLLRGAIEEVDRIERNVRDLMELTTAPTPQPLDTSASEILKSALRQLPEAQRARVRTTSANAVDRVEADAPIVADALRRVIENALEASPEDVLVVIRNDADERALHLAVVNGETQPFDAAWAAEPFHSLKPSHLGLGLTLVTRNIRAHGGEVVFERLDSGGTRIVLRVPTRAGSNVNQHESLLDEAA